MVTKELIVAVFLLGVPWAWAQSNGDHPALPKYMTDQCIKNGGEAANNNVERAIKQLGPCYSRLADRIKLLQDIEEAQRLSGSAKGVFKKYCAGKSEFMRCITVVTESFKPCFRAGERARGNLDVVRNVIDQVLQFTCEQDGAMSTSFDGAGSLECLKQPGRGEALLGCSYGLAPILKRSSDTTIVDVLDIEFDVSTCERLATFQKCVVQELKTCGQEIGHAAESLLQRVWLTTPCNTKKPKPNSASGRAVTLLTSAMAASTLILM